jgi:hypothetical protein
MHSERRASRSVRASVAKTVLWRGRLGAYRPEAGAGCPYWLAASALEGFEGKEWREAYYARL